MKNLISLLFLMCFQLLMSQSIKITAIKTNEINFEADNFIGRDGFGSLFYIKNNVLFKKTEGPILQYQNVSLGQLTTVDIINPLKIILFYQQFNSVVVVDNQMNEIQRIDFSNASTPIMASAVGMSGQNKIWLYNSLNQQIGLFDLTNNQYQNLGIPIPQEPIHYQSDFNYFHWIDPQQIWHTTTIFGRVFSNGKVEGDSIMQLIDIDKAFFLEGNKLFMTDIKQNKRYEIGIVEKSFKKSYYKDQILSIFTDKGITNYKITLP